MTPEKEGFHVLVVDDMPEIRRIIRHVLERAARVRITEAENGLDAISKMLADTPDLVITDVVMPRMTGLELIGFIQQQQNLMELPVIILTSQHDERIQMQALGLHARAFLQKPVNPQKLLEAIRSCIPPGHLLQPT